MTPGTDCDFTLAHASVNAGVATGFYLAADRGRKTFSSRRSRPGSPARLVTGRTALAEYGGGAREWRLLVRFEPYGVDYRQAAAGGGTLAQLRELYVVPGGVLTLAAPDRSTYSVRFLALEEKSHPPEPGTTAEIVLVEV